MQAPRKALQLVVAAAVALLLIGCAARTVKPPDPGVVGRAERLVAQGCHDCLLEARELLEPLAATSPDPGTGLTRLFEVQLLLVLRRKELAMDVDLEMERARTLAARLPAHAGADRYLELVEAIPPDRAGTPNPDRRMFPPGIQDLQRYAGDALTWLESQEILPLLNGYLTTAVQCTLVPPRPDATEAPPTDQPPPPPLLAFRRALCNPLRNRPALEQYLSAVPRAVETGLFLARGGMATLATGGSRILPPLEGTYARFADSPAVTYELATITQALGDCRRAVGHYSETLSLRPRHDDARLGRTICWSHLNEPREAIADATVLIEASATNYGDAFYWRAWNRHRLAELDLARADIERAKTLRYASHVLTLAGIIEHDQAELKIARSDLATATQLDGTNCTARWYLGVVEYRAERWLDSAGAFAESAGCYAASASSGEAQRAVMLGRDDLEEDFRTRQIAAFDAAIGEDRNQESASALNAALNYARAGDRVKATEYLDRAAADARRSEKVEELRRILAGRP